jgi:response regulator NasT
MEVAQAHFNEFQAMRRNLEEAETRLSERKTIDRAKSILMKQRNWSEDQAYQALRKTAMDRGQRIGEVASNIIAAADLLT